MIKEVRMFTTRGGRKRYVLTSEEDTRYYAYKAGWRQDRKGLYYCPLHTPIPEERKPIPKAVRELAEICGVVIE